MLDAPAILKDIKSVVTLVVLFYLMLLQSWKILNLSWNDSEKACWGTLLKHSCPSMWVYSSFYRCVFIEPEVICLGFCSIVSFTSLWMVFPAFIFSLRFQRLLFVPFFPFDNAWNFVILDSWFSFYKWSWIIFPWISISVCSLEYFISWVEYVCASGVIL